MCVRESVTRGFDELRYNESQGFIQKKKSVHPLFKRDAIR